MRKARVKGKLQAKVKVSTPTVDAALDGAPPTELAQAETTAVLGLTAVFAAIMIEGLLVAASGFMSEEWDGIVQARAPPSLRLAPRRLTSCTPALAGKGAAHLRPHAGFLPAVLVRIRCVCSYAATLRSRVRWRAGTGTGADAGNAAGVWKAYGKQN